MQPGTAEIERTPPRAASGPKPADARLVRVVVAAGGAYGLVYGAIWIAQFSGINDFFVFWSAARWVAERGFDPAIYDVEAFRAFQTQLLAQTAGAYRPYAYPPTGLLAFAPLAGLALAPALAAFLGLSLAGYLAAIAWGRGKAAVALAASPAALMNIVVGQNGFLTAGLLYGGLHLAGRRPWIAGILIGLLSIKPQLGLLVPVALLASRQWICLTAAASATLALAAASVIAGGVEIWTAWLELLPRFAANTAANSESASRFMVSPPAVLLTLGLDYATARIVHLPIALGLAGAVWVMCRRFGLTPLTVAAVATATLLATPFAYFYDLTIAAAATAILAADALKRGFLPGEKLVLALVWVAPLIAVADLPLSWLVTLALALQFLAIWRRLAAAPTVVDGTAP